MSLRIPMMSFGLWNGVEIGQPDSTPARVADTLSIHCRTSFILKEATQNLATCGLFILYTASSEKRVGGFTKIEVEESRQSQLPRRGKFPWYTRVLEAVGVKPSNKGSSIM